METTVHTISMGMSLAYLIESADGLTLIDAGSPGKEDKVLKLMKEIGRDDLRLIFITHAHLDHYGSAAVIQRQTGAQIAVHQDDAEIMAQGATILGEARGRGRILPPFIGIYERFRGPEPTHPDLILSDGERLDDFGLDGWLLHTPGHTRGSSCLIVNEEMAFVGDLITNNGRPRLQRLYAQDWDALPASFERLKSVDPTVIYPGHGQRPISKGQLQKVTL
jgi:glyoxylase-like metal-dependent hydrolase (beta-lactamase superfamily II)